MEWNWPGGKRESRQKGLKDLEVASLGTIDEGDWKFVYHSVTAAILWGTVKHATVD